MAKSAPARLTEQPLIPETVNIPIGQITKGAGIRKVDKRKLSSLIASIREVGLINPLTVVQRPNPSGAAPYIVLCGNNRYEACVVAGLDPIPCRCVGEQDAKNADHKIMQTDENLVRIGLTNDEMETHLAARKFWYEAKHPETKKGGAPGKAGGGKKKAKPAKLAGFVEDTAAVTGMSERSVERNTERGEKIDRTVSASLTGTPLDTGKYRDELKNTPKDQQTDKVAKDLNAVKDREKKVNELLKIGTPVKEIAELTGSSPHTIRRKKESNDYKEKILRELAEFDRFKKFFKSVIAGFSDVQREELMSIMKGRMH